MPAPDGNFHALIDHFSLSTAHRVTPLVSIIIPACNAAPWIADTLRSALAQTWPATEIIVIDDGSQDKTPAIARGFVSEGIRVITQSNAGASAARNHGLRLARGELIQFLDADDLLAPDKIERQIGLLSLRTDMLVSAEWVRFTDNPSSAVFTVQPTWRDLSGVEFLRLCYENMLMMHPAAWLAPRALLDRAGPWDESISLNDDGEYFARVALAARSIAFCPGARSYYRSNLTGSLSHRKDSRALDSLYRSVGLILGHLLAADRSPRTLAAAAFAWKWTAFELYPGRPDLAHAAELESKKLGGSIRPFPGSGRFQLLSRLLGWRLARRLTA